MIDWRALPGDWKVLPPKATGVYFLVNGETVAYVGRSGDIRMRIWSHHSTRSEFRSGAWSARYHLCRRAEMRRLERECVFHYQPPFNVTLRNSPTRSRGSRGPSNLSDMLLAWREKNHLLYRDAAAKIGIAHHCYRGIEEGWRFRNSDLQAVIRWLLQ